MKDCFDFICSFYPELVLLNRYFIYWSDANIPLVSFFPVHVSFSIALNQCELYYSYFVISISLPYQLYAVRFLFALW